MVVNSEVQNGSCVTYSIFGDMFDFQVYFIWYLKIITNTESYLPELPQQPDKKNKAW